MFAYLIIGVELAVIYAVFWYVFLREPKSHLNKDGSMESYSRRSNVSTAYGANSPFPKSQSPKSLSNQDSLNSSLRPQIHSPHISRASRSQSKTECTCSLHSCRRRGQRLQLTWLPIEALPPGSSLVERLCLNLGRKLIQFSLKIS
jgi:hypothetical protein